MIQCVIVAGFAMIVAQESGPGGVTVEGVGLDGGISVPLEGASLSLETEAKWHTLTIQRDGKVTEIELLRFDPMSDPNSPRASAYHGFNIPDFVKSCK